MVQASAPHPQQPCGRCGTVSSGTATQGSALPATPFCLPRLRPEFFARFGARLRPARKIIAGRRRGGVPAVP